MEGENPVKKNPLKKNPRNPVKKNPRKRDNPEKPDEITDLAA